jgi:hypothetical protein
MIIDGMSAELLIEEKYYLAKYMHMNPLDSEMLPIFEADAYLNLIIRDLQEKAKSMPRLS